MSKYKFRQIVDKKVKQLAADRITLLQMEHSKTKYLLQDKQIKDYLVSEKMSTEEKKWLFKMRVRMCPNKTNFENLHRPNLACSLCKDETTRETEIHLLQCPFFQKNPELKEEMGRIKYEDIFGELKKQIRAVRVWIMVIKIYDNEKENARNLTARNPA